MENEQALADLRVFIQTNIPVYQRSKLLELLDKPDATQEDFEVLGKTLTGETQKDSMFLPTGPGSANKRSMWNSTKKEVYKFFCTESSEYSQERNGWVGSIKDVIPVLATAVASELGVAISVVIGVVTLVVMSVLKITRNAWCDCHKDII